MSILDLSGLFNRRIRSVSLFGFGKGASSLIPHLLTSKYEVSVRDDRRDIGASLPSGVKPLLGDAALSEPYPDLMIISPSVRRDRLFDLGLHKQAIMTSDTDLFFRLYKKKSFAISGSSGKSTSATLLYELLSTSGSSQLVGNIGVPMTDAYLRENITRAVCELSSFNLQYDDVHPSRAAITNIKRNHLNWHRDFAEYKESKLRLLYSASRFSVNLDDESTSALALNSDCYACYSLKFDYQGLHNVYKDKIVFTKSEDGIFKNDTLILPARFLSGYAKYNIYNLLCALSLAEGEYDDSALCDVVSSHRSLSHRCECFMCLGGIKFIDSSIDTSPDRTYETLSSLSDRVLILLGGRSKGESYAPLSGLIKRKCKTVVAFGEAAEKISAEIFPFIGDIPTATFKTMREAALYAIFLANDGDTVLLSPASTSFDEFASFEQRGDTFKQLINDAFRQKNIGEHNEKDN